MMKRYENIKAMILYVRNDGDFNWNLKSFPRKKIEDEYLENTVVVYFKDPTPTDIANSIQRIASEFKESFDSYKNRLHEFKEYVYDELMGTAEDIKNELLPIESSNLVYIDSGNYELSLTLKDYVEEEIVFVNTDEKYKIKHFDLFDNA